MSPSITARPWVLVAISAAIGAGLRWCSVGLVGDRPGLLLCNMAGCGVIGYAVARRSGPWLTAGFCGALTSCSSIALQVAIDIDNRQVIAGFGWLAATLLLCAGAFASARRLGCTEGLG